MYIFKDWGDCSLMFCSEGIVVVGWLFVLNKMFGNLM